MTVLISMLIDFTRCVLSLGPSQATVSHVFVKYERLNNQPPVSPVRSSRSLSLNVTTKVNASHLYRSPLCIRDVKGAMAVKFAA